MTDKKHDVFNPPVINRPLAIRRGIRARLICKGWGKPTRVREWDIDMTDKKRINFSLEDDTMDKLLLIGHNQRALGNKAMINPQDKKNVSASAVVLWLIERELARIGYQNVKTDYQSHSFSAIQSDKKRYDRT